MGLGSTLLKGGAVVIGGAAVLVGAGVALNEAFNIASGAAAIFAGHPALIKSAATGLGGLTGAALLGYGGFKWGSKNFPGHLGSGIGEAIVGVLAGAALGGMGGWKIADTVLDHLQPTTSGAMTETIDHAKTLAVSNMAYKPSLRI